MMGEEGRIKVIVDLEGAKVGELVGPKGAPC